jgi:hypothetical protein
MESAKAGTIKEKERKTLVRSENILQEPEEMYKGRGERVDGPGWSCQRLSELV